MIERRKDQEPVKSFICVIDNLYRGLVYIKVDTKQYEEIVISFHEDNKRGIAKSNQLIKAEKQKYVPIFADSVLSKVSDENKYIVKAIFQRGLTVLPLELPAVKCQDVFIIEKNAINSQFVSYCNDYIRDLYTSDFALVTFVRNLKLTEEQQTEIKELLQQKYLVSDIRKSDLILERIETNLALNYNG